MTTAERQRIYELWFASRPPSVQRLAREWPIPMNLEFSDGRLYTLIGYSEHDALIFAPSIELEKNWDAAVETMKVYICASHFRRGEIVHSKLAEKHEPRQVGSAKPANRLG